MKYYLWLIMALSMALSVAISSMAAGTSPELFRIMATRQKLSAAPATGTKLNLFARYSSAQGIEFRLVEIDSVLELGGMDTTAPDGKRWDWPYNSVPFSDTPMVGMFQTTPAGPQWYGTKDGVTGWHEVGGGVPGSNGYVATPPAFKDTPCTLGQWSTDSTKFYACAAPNTWGYIAYSLDLPTADTTPDAFSFTSQTDAALNTWVYSDAVEVTGISVGASSPISVTGGSYKIDSGEWQTTPGTIGNGQMVTAGHTSAATNSTATTTTVTIGGVDGTFTSTTVAAASSAVLNESVKAAGPQAGGVINPPDSTNPYFNYSPVVAGSTGSVTYAHWNMSSSGTPNAATSKFMIYDASGVVVCQSTAVSGTGVTPQSIDVPLSGCSLTSGNTYLVGVCTNADGSTVNSPYLTNLTSGPVTKRVQVACDGSSFDPSNGTNNPQMSGTRPIFAWGDNSASR